MEPRRLVKPGGGWFEEALGLEPGGARAALVRTDDATFAKVEIVDLGTGATAASFDLSPAARPVERLELLPGAKEVLVIARRARPRVNGMEQAPLYTATLVDGAGRAGPTVGPAAGFVWRTGGPLLALGRHEEAGGEVTYTLTPFELPTLAQAGKTHLAPHPGHPDRERFAALNQAQAGVDIVDEMGTSRPADLAIAFELYDRKSLRDQEGPERGTVYFSLADQRRGRQARQAGPADARPLQRDRRAREGDDHAAGAPVHAAAGDVARGLRQADRAQTGPQARARPRSRSRSRST